MNLLTGTLSGAFNQIVKSVQLSTLAPASIFVLLNFLYILPGWNLKIGVSLFEISLIVLIIVTFSYVLWLLNGPLIRFLEGYLFENTSLGRYWSEKHRKCMRKLIQDIKECNDHIARAQDLIDNELILDYNDPTDHPDYWKVLNYKIQWSAARRRYLEEYRTHYAIDEEQMLPTKLGNTIASFEYYPYSRYNMDAIVFWPRLVPILEKKGFTRYVEQEKAAFDFLLNFTTITAFLGLECLWLALWLPNLYWLIGTIGATLFYLISYPVLTESAVYWGTTVKVAFDLFRHDLRNTLLITRPKSLKHERELWGKASGFFAEEDKFPTKVGKEIGTSTIWTKLNTEFEDKSLPEDLWNYGLLDQPPNKEKETKNETKDE